MLTPTVARAAAVVLTASVASLGLGVSGGSFGLHERVVAALTVVWPLVTAIGVWWWAGHRIGSHRVRQGLGVLAVTLACIAAGVAATAVAPATAHTRHYQASVALDPDPTHLGQILATTAFGDLELGFAGAAPGIRTVPQVNASIADALSRPQVSLATLRPGPEELSAAIRDVAVDVLIRFAAGGLLLIGSVLAADAVLRRRRPPVALVARLHRRVGARDGRHRDLAVRDLPARSDRRPSPRPGSSARSSATRGSCPTSRLAPPRSRPTCATSSPCRRPCSRSTPPRRSRPTPRCGCCS